MDYAVFASPSILTPAAAGAPDARAHISHSGTKWMTFEEIAVDFRKRPSTAASAPR
jgi:hypothetical protein